MLRRMPPHHMEQVHARLERTHHASYGLVEHPIGNMIKQMTLELKVDDEVNVSLVPNRRERPRVCQVLQRPFDGAHQHLSRSVQRDLARETFLEWTEADDEVGDDLSLVLAVDTRAAAPGDEQGIVLHVSHDREKLVGTIGERRLLLETRHVTPPALYATPATHRTAGRKRDISAIIRRCIGLSPHMDVRDLVSRSCGRR